MKNKGFTLVEILIVVVILGILAAIVIPQFSDASTQSKVSNAASSVQTMRSQLSLYKIQHNDTLPGNTTALFTAAMTQCSDADASLATDYADRTATNVSTHPYGPYLKTVPKNPFNNSNTIGTGDATGVGWVYDNITGDINLAITDVDSTDVQDELVTKGVAVALSAG